MRLRRAGLCCRVETGGGGRQSQGVVVVGVGRVLSWSAFQACAAGERKSAESSCNVSPGSWECLAQAGAASVVVFGGRDRVVCAGGDQGTGSGNYCWAPPGMWGCVDAWRVWQKITEGGSERMARTTIATVVVERREASNRRDDYGSSTAAQQQQSRRRLDGLGWTGWTVDCGWWRIGAPLDDAGTPQAHAQAHRWADLST